MGTGFWDVTYEDGPTLPWQVVLPVVAGVVLAIWLLTKVNCVAGKAIAITFAVWVLASLGSGMRLSRLAD